MDTKLQARLHKVNERATRRRSEYRKPLPSDTPVYCAQCNWTGIVADLDSPGRCVDCESSIRPIRKGSLLDSKRVLDEITKDMMPSY